MNRGTRESKSVRHDMSTTVEQAEGTFSLAALTTVLPPPLVAAALEAQGVVAERVRKLPPELVAWLLIGMAIFRTLSAENVLRRVLDGLTGFVRFGAAEVPCATSITHARDRVGWRAMRAVFRRFAEFLLGKYEAAMTWRGLRLFALDGSCFLVPDTAKNEATFGRPGSSRGGKSGYPQMRAVVLVSAMTHLVVDAVAGAFRTGELSLAQKLLRRLPTDALVLMDRAYYSFAWLASLTKKGKHFLCRVKGGGTSLKPKKRKRLGPNEWLATLSGPEYLRRRRPELQATLEVRLIKYTAKGFRPVTLVTDLLDPIQYPAQELAALYYDRWEVELALREIKVRQAERKVTFRSHTPGRVLQEFYALLVAYNAVRALMVEAAQEAGVDPRGLSFTDCLERIRTVLPLLASMTPGAQAQLLERLVLDLAQCRLPKRRVGRRCPRAVKIKMSKWPRKRPGTKTVARSRCAR